MSAAKCRIEGLVRAFRTSIRYFGLRPLQLLSTNGEGGMQGLIRSQHPLISRNPQHRLLQLFKRAHFDLADAFAADAVTLA